jgi:anti-sigma B factor antagonist
MWQDRLIVNLVGEYSIFHFWCRESSQFSTRRVEVKMLKQQQILGPGEEDVDLDIRQSGSICCLKLKGPLKYGEGVKQLDEAVEGAISSGHIHLLLDLSAMPYIDSSGIGAIVDALRQAKKVGGDAKLVSPSPFAAKTFKMVGILTLFKVYDSEAEAVEACPA